MCRFGAMAYAAYRFIGEGGVQLVDLRDEFGDCPQLYGPACKRMFVCACTWASLNDGLRIRRGGCVHANGLCCASWQVLTWRRRLIADSCGGSTLAVHHDMQVVQHAACNTHRCTVRFDPRYFELGFFAAKFRRV